MASKRLVASWIVISLCLPGRLAFAGQGCCSTHSGVAGCAGAKLQCNDGTFSPTCSCQDGAISSASQAQGKLALMEAGSPEVKPYVSPIPAASPINTVDTIPPREKNQLGDPGDIPLPQQHPKPHTTPNNSPESPDHLASKESPAASTVESEPKSPPEEAKKQPTTGNAQKQGDRARIPSVSELKGKSVEEVEQLLKERGFEGEPTREGEASGQRFPSPGKPGEQVRIMRGKPNDPNPVKRGPYTRISADGKVSEPIPLKGNPTLQ